jgi:hypothetical protein
LLGDWFSAGSQETVGERIGARGERGAEEKPAPAIADPLPEEATLFEKVAAELNSDERQPGPWARALAEADGDLLKAQARYIQIRVRALAASPQAAPHTDSSGSPDVAMTQKAETLKK